MLEKISKEFYGRNICLANLQDERLLGILNEWDAEQPERVGEQGQDDHVHLPDTRQVPVHHLLILSWKHLFWVICVLMFGQYFQYMLYSSVYPLQELKIRSLLQGPLNQLKFAQK